MNHIFLCLFPYCVYLTFHQYCMFTPLLNMLQRSEIIFKALYVFMAFVCQCQFYLYRIVHYMLTQCY